MTDEQRKNAAQWLVDFYSAVSQGKTTQVQGATGEWIDCSTVDYWPGINSALNRKHEWRIKPEPRRMWRDERGAVTTDKEDADAWKRQGHTVTEWVEVV